MYRDKDRARLRWVAMMAAPVVCRVFGHRIEFVYDDAFTGVKTYQCLRCRLTFRIGRRAS